ncbi:hypothetical protein [Nocardiopsis chromatogenes]|uniref:hypothetical protein n=1 Tax=Nocardiopsis chromatogenes TaxID=280239 RepID=UPI001268D833|nr:hypothetical protein [Nocardiopsis chromatogenes]
MPKIEHEFLTELFQNDPNLAVELVEQEVGGRLPRFTKVTLQSNRVNKVDPPGDDRRLGGPPPRSLEGAPCPRQTHRRRGGDHRGDPA